MLADIDALVYDIQDNGCRSYTFISTLGKAMEACIEHDKEMVVLDRPNPLGGNRVEGPVTDPDCISFVSQYRIPYIYGLTAGELALYLNDTEFGGKARLTVVPMEGWTRTMTYADTGMPWVLTSPHIPSAETTLLYPATGIMGELDYISIGVGYTMPFRVACARWIDAARLTERLNALNLPGIRFRPLHIKPYYGFGKGEQLHGVELHITDPDKAELTLIQFYIMQELAAMYPENAASRRRLPDATTCSTRCAAAAMCAVCSPAHTVWPTSLTYGTETPPDSKSGRHAIICTDRRLTKTANDQQTTPGLLQARALYLLFSDVDIYFFITLTER